MNNVKIKEIWKNIEGYEELYMVSNLGKVKSLNYRGNGTESILKGSFTHEGYKKVDLYKNSKRKTFHVHQLVAIAFLNHTPSGLDMVIDHINHIKSDNRLSNLQVVTHRFNLNREGNKKPGIKPKEKDYTDYKGVYKFKGKWKARFCLNGKYRQLGLYNTKEEAKMVFRNANKKHGIT